MMEADKSAIIRINLRIAEASRRGVDSAFTPRLFSPSGILNIRKLRSGYDRPIRLLTRASHPSTIVPPPMPFFRAQVIIPKGLSL